MRLGQTHLNGNGRRVPTVELLSPGKDVVGTLREARLAAQSTGVHIFFCFLHSVYLTVVYLHSNYMVRNLKNKITCIYQYEICSQYCCSHKCSSVLRHVPQGSSHFSHPVVQEFLVMLIKIKLIQLPFLLFLMFINQGGSLVEEPINLVEAYSCRAYWLLAPHNLL